VKTKSSDNFWQKLPLEKHFTCFFKNSKISPFVKLGQTAILASDTNQEKMTFQHVPTSFRLLAIVESPYQISRSSGSTVALPIGFGYIGSSYQF
jgi:hypothetical protein